MACHLLAMGLHRAWGPAAPRLQGQEAVQASLRSVLQGQHKFAPGALVLLQVRHSSSRFASCGSSSSSRIGHLNSCSIWACACLE